MRANSSSKQITVKNVFKLKDLKLLSLCKMVEAIIFFVACCSVVALVVLNALSIRACLSQAQTARIERDLIHSALFCLAMFGIWVGIKVIEIEPLGKGQSYTSSVVDVVNNAGAQEKASPKGPAAR